MIPHPVIVLIRSSGKICIGVELLHTNLDFGEFPQVPQPGPVQ